MDNEEKKYLKTLFKKQRKYIIGLIVAAILANILNFCFKIGIDFFQLFLLEYYLF